MADGTENFDVDVRRGLSRRQLIKASAVAGAAAWTAPMIIDSLSSPAAAGSLCHKYYVKLIGPGGTGTVGKCFDADPACGPGREVGTCSTCPGNSMTPNNPAPKLYLPGTVGGTTDSGYIGFYKVVLDSTSTFSSTFNWAVMANYELCHSGGGCTTLAALASGTIPSGNGYYVNGGDTAYIAKTVVGDGHGGTSGYDVCYFYLQFCSTTAKKGTADSGTNCTDCTHTANCGT